MATDKHMTDAERRQMVERDRENWAPESDQDDREIALAMEVLTHDPDGLQ